MTCGLGLEVKVIVDVFYLRACYLRVRVVRWSSVEVQSEFVDVRIMVARGLGWRLVDPSIVLTFPSRQGLVFTGVEIMTCVRGQVVRAVVAKVGMLRAARHVAASSTGIMIKPRTRPEVRQPMVLLSCGWLRLRSVRVMKVLSWRLIWWVSRLVVSWVCGLVSLRDSSIILQLVGGGGSETALCVVWSTWRLLRALIFRTGMIG